VEPSAEHKGAPAIVSEVPTPQEQVASLSSGDLSAAQRRVADGRAGRASQKKAAAASVIGKSLGNTANRVEARAAEMWPRAAEVWPRAAEVWLRGGPHSCRSRSRP